MAHELSNADQARLVLRHKRAWHGLGNIIPDDLSAVEAGERFGLFDPVEQYELAAFSRSKQTAKYNEVMRAIVSGTAQEALQTLKDLFAAQVKVTSHVANVMTGDDAQPDNLLGVVGASYQTVQNRDLAEFTDALAQSGKVVIETAGTIQNGKKIWFMARGESLQIGGIDEVKPYILVSNSHDGTQSIRVTPTTTRVVCSNTLHCVIPRNEGSTLRCDNAAIVMRHTGDVQEKLEAAKHALKHYNEVMEQNQRLFETLRKTSIDRDKALEFFAGQYSGFGWAVPTNEELLSGDKEEKKLALRRKKKMDQAAADFLKRWDDERNIAGETAWNAMNAMTGYIQHDVAAKGKDDTARLENKISTNLFGLNATRSQAVLEAALAI